MATKSKTKTLGSMAPPLYELVPTREDNNKQPGADFNASVSWVKWLNDVAGITSEFLTRVIVTTDATPAAVFEAVIEDESVLVLFGELIAVYSDRTDALMKTVKAIFRASGGVATLIDSDIDHEIGVALTAAFDVDANRGRLMVTGNTNRIAWTLKCRALSFQGINS